MKFVYYALCAALLLGMGTASAASEILPAETAETLSGAPAEETGAGKDGVRDIDGAPLSAADLTLAGLRLGASPETARGILGEAEKENSRSVWREAQWEGLAVRFLSETAYTYAARPDLEMDRKWPSAGAAQISVTAPGKPTVRGIAVGSSRENAARVYGEPSRVYWDGPKQLLYLLYETDGQQLVFTVEDNRISAVTLAWAGTMLPEGQTDHRTPGQRFSGEDFQIAGYRVNGTFQEHSWMIWEKKAVNPEEEIWQYPGFGVRMDAKTHRISSLFITDSSMVTRRGVSIGDQQSTVEALYGAPQKLEMNLAEPHPQSAYIYFSEDRKLVLIFYMNETEKTVQNIVAMRNPQIPDPLAPALERIRSVRMKNHSEAL